MKAYQKQHHISEAKYCDLQKMCNKMIIPAEYHHEYFQMPQSSSTLDCLEETGEENSVDGEIVNF
jgi:hypothetical protein